MKRFAMMTMIALTSLITVTSSSQNIIADQPVATAQRAEVVVNPNNRRPRLGVSGQMTNRGYRISYVKPYSTAARMGLEKGDVIVRVNDVFLRSSAELVTALDEAANSSYYRGKVSLKVENIRWHQRLSDQRFVKVNGNLYR